MRSRRSLGVAVVGVLNVLLGAVGGALATAMLRAARVPDAAPTTWGLDTPETVRTESLLFFGGARLVLAVLAVASGVLILRGAVAGRLFGLLFAWGSVVVNVAEARGFGYPLVPHALMSSLYPLILIVLLNRAEWRRDPGTRPPAPEGG